MPVRSLNSSVLVWPSRESILRELEAWAEEQRQRNPNIIKIGYFGSLARNNWGVGSDIDLVVIVAQSNLPFIRRAPEWNTLAMSAPVDLLVYTSDEWSHAQNYFAKEIVWLNL